MVKTSHINVKNNSINGTTVNDNGVVPGPTVPILLSRMKCNKQVNNIVMEFYNRDRLVDCRGVTIRGYMKRLTQEWRKRRYWSLPNKRYMTRQRL